ncbi:MAG: hypothetical protein KatS3mg111_0889 [Pirellulaceae bacterium]|nr:MAG: hypothetical protein KatS3mg111_0889 [Pirellulaceae bacterium]
MNENEKQNTRLSDQVFDSLLTEMLSGQRPPDLSERIITAWRQQTGVDAAQQASAAAGHSDGLKDAHTASSASGKQGKLLRESGKGHDTGDGLRASSEQVVCQRSRTAAAIGQQVSLAVHGRRRSTREHVSSSSFWMVVAAAAIAVAISGPILVRHFPRPADELRAEVGTSQRGEKSPVPSPGPRREATATAIAASQGNLPDDDATALNVPPAAPPAFPLGAPKAGQVSTAQLPTSGGGVAGSDALVPEAEPLPEKELVGHVDAMLVQMWESLGLVPSPDLPPEQFMARAHLRLLGQPADSQLLGRVANLKNAADHHRMVSYLTRQPDFVDRLAEFLSNELLSAADRALRGELAEPMRQEIGRVVAGGDSWGELIARWFGASATSGGEAIPPLDDEDERGWAQAYLLQILAQNDRQRALERLGGVLLDANVACVRCHDQRHQLPDIPRRELIDRQDEYWGMLALWQGIQWQSSDSQAPRVVDRQQQLLAGEGLPPVYFERPDGRLQLAFPQLPGGRQWSEVDGADTPRVAFARWLLQSGALDRAAVNQAWRLVFGRPLVPMVDQLEPAGYPQRVALQEFLASQFRAHARDLRQLVQWIASSEAMQRSPATESPHQVLVASEEQLLQWKLQEGVFAAAPAPGIAPDRSLSAVEALASLADWIGGASLSPGNVLLAQPAPLPSADKKRRTGSRPQEPSSSRSQQPTINFYIHRQVPTPAEKEFVRRLVANERLSWEQRVEHVIGLSDTTVDPEKIQQLAAQLLRKRENNMEETLYDLLWAIKQAR